MLVEIVASINVGVFLYILFFLYTRREAFNRVFRISRKISSLYNKMETALEESPRGLPGISLHQGQFDGLLPILTKNLLASKETFSFKDGRIVVRCGEHAIYLPFLPDTTHTMSKYKVLLKLPEREDERSSKSSRFVDITQPFGVPYLCTAKQLGGVCIVFEHTNSKVRTFFREDEIPHIHEEEHERLERNEIKYSE